MRWEVWALALAVVMAASTPIIPVARGEGIIVNCFDANRNIVQKSRRDDCHGTVISEEEAAKVNEARRAYVRRAFQQQPATFGEGKKLRGIGTGFFVSADGTLVTNGHVVRDCDVVSVSTADGRSVAARIRGWDNGKDLALLHVDVEPDGTARIVPRQPNIGAVAMVGYPDQGIPPIKPLLTAGRMLGTERVGDDLTVLKIQADVRPGNSGGPLLDQRGNVVGVVFAEINTPKVFRSTGQIVRDIGYVIPGETVIAFLERWRIPYWQARPDAGAGSDLLASARPYIARIGCWR